MKPGFFHRGKFFSRVRKRVLIYCEPTQKAIIMFVHAFTFLEYSVYKPIK